MFVVNGAAPESAIDIVIITVLLFSTRYGYKRVLIIMYELCTSYYHVRVNGAAPESLSILLLL